MRHAITALPILLCFLLGTPARGGPKIIRYRTPSGAIGFAQDPTGVPPGAQILREAPSGNGALNTIRGLDHTQGLEARKRRLEALDEERQQKQERRSTEISQLKSRQSELELQEKKSEISSEQRDEIARQKSDLQSQLEDACHGISDPGCKPSED